MEKDTMRAEESSSASQEAVLDKIRKMEEELLLISKRRSQKNMVSGGGILLIILVLAGFVVNLMNMASGFDTGVFAEELSKHAMLATQSDDAKKLINELQKETIPMVRDEVVNQFKNRTDEIHNKAMESVKNLQHYLENDVREKLHHQVTSTLEQMEADILKRYPKIPPERIGTVLEKAQNEFVDQLTDMLEIKLDVVFRDITALNKTVAQFTDDPHYRSLDKEKIGEVENMLIESMLELAIYNINPDKGRLPAEGGAK